MKNTFIYLFVITFCTSSKQQDDKVFNYYSVDPVTSDTAFYCQVKKENSGGYIFRFGDIIETQYFLADSTSTKIDSTVTTRQVIFGPYFFRKMRNSIRFKNLQIDNRYRPLYLFSESMTLLPEIFSTSSTGIHLTNMVTDNAQILFRGNYVKAYKFLQLIREDQGAKYRITYVDQATLLPLRIEYYTDQNLKDLLSYVFLE